jgi:hypothetical protein
LGKGKDITGQKFGSLEVLEPVGRRHNAVVWKCRCECGNITCVPAKGLKTGDSKSCGCLHAVAAKKNLTAAYPRNFQYDTHIGKAFMQKLQKNNTSGVKGVLYRKPKGRLKTGRWLAIITFRKKNYYLGAYKTIAEAAAVRKRAEEKIHGDFLEWLKKQGDKKTLDDFLKWLR